MSDVTSVRVDKTMPQTFVAPNSVKGLPPEHNDSAAPIDTGTNPDGRVQKVPRLDFNTPDKVKRDTLKPEPGDQSKPIPRTVNVEKSAEEDKDAALYNPRTKFKRQRRQRGQARVKSRRRYRKNRKRTLQRAKIRYRKIKNDPRYKRKKRLRRKYPTRYKRRWAGVLTAPEIHFLIGPDLTVGVVHGVSPLTGMVTYGTTGGIASIPVMTFLSSVAFFTEHDIQAMFDLVDAEVGEEAYEDLIPADIHGVADLEGVNWDGDSRFMARCESLTGCKHLDDMDSEQLSLIADALTSGEFVEGKPNRLQVEDKGDPHEKDPTDDSYYYGEVDLPEYWGKLASPGVIHLYDQEPNPSEGAERLDHGKLRDHEKHTPGAKAPKPDEALYGQGDRARPKNLEPVKMAATMEQVIGNTFAPVHERAQDLDVNPFRFNPGKGVWLFNVTGASGSQYRVRIKGIRKGNVKALRKAQIKLSCSCPFWRWQGPEHWAKQNDYLYGRARGTASQPVVRDPKSNHWACKHVLAALRFARNYHFSNEDGGDLGALQALLRNAEFEIVASPDADAAHVASVRRVVARYLERTEVRDADL